MSGDGQVEHEAIDEGSADKVDTSTDRVARLHQTITRQIDSHTDTFFTTLSLAGVESTDEETLADTGKSTVEAIVREFGTVRTELQGDQELREELNGFFVDASITPLLLQAQIAADFPDETRDEFQKLYTEGLNQKAVIPEEEREKNEERKHEMRRLIFAMGYPNNRSIAKILDTYGWYGEPTANTANDLLALLVQQQQQEALSHFSTQVAEGAMPTDIKEDIQASIEAATPSLRVDPTLTTQASVDFWQAMKEAQFAGALFTSEEIETVDAALEQSVRERLLVMPNDQNRRVDLGKAMMRFTTAEAAPIVLMNAWREPGYHGNWANVRNLEFTGFRDDALQHPAIYEYVASLPDEELAALRERNIHGIVEVIDIIKQHPDEFYQESIRNFDERRFSTKNPVYERLMQQLGKTAIHYVREGNSDEQAFAADFLGYPAIKLTDEDYDTLFGVLERELDPKLQDTLLSVMAYNNHRSGMKKVVEAYGNVRPEVQELIKQQAKDYLRVIIIMEAPPDTDFINSLAPLLDTEPAQLLKTIDYARKLPKKDYLPPFEPEKAQEYIALANDPQTSAKTLELCEAGYHFDIDHLPLLQAIGDESKHIEVTAKQLNALLAGKFKPDSVDAYVEILQSPSQLTFVERLDNLDFVFQPNHAPSIKRVVEETSEEQLQKTFEFMRSLKEQGNLHAFFIQELPQFVQLANDERTVAKTLTLCAEGYLFSIYHLPLLREIANEQNGIDITASQLNALTRIQLNQALLDVYVQVSKDRELLRFIDELKIFGYKFDPRHEQELTRLQGQREELFAEVATIRDIYPAYQYEITRTAGPEPEFITDPYEVFANSVFYDKYMEIMRNALMKDGEIPPAILNGLYANLRRKNTEGLFRMEESSEEGKEQFRRAVRTVLEKTQDEESELYQYKDFFTNQYALTALACQPHASETVLNFPTEVPQLFEFLREGGELHTSSDVVFRDIFSHQDPKFKAEEVINIFKKKIPYWKKLYFYTETRIGTDLINATSQYPVTDIPGTDPPTNNGIDFNNDFAFVSQPVEGMSVEQKREFADLGEMTDDEIAELTAIQFTQLRSEQKKLVFASMLSRTIDTSRDAAAKQAANARNREVHETLQFEPGTYVHAGSIDFLDATLLNGNLPGEALGEKAKTDSRPFHVDFSHLTEAHLAEHQGVEGALENTISASTMYGGHDELGEKGQLFYIYKRSHASWEPGIQHTTDLEKQTHALVLGGMPSTEISGIVLRDPEATLERTRRSIVENGFYVPLYNMQGELLFTADDYDKIYEDHNMHIPVEVWDASLKTGDQQGGTPGGTFTIPTNEGPESHYVKFSSTEDITRLWNEQLTDNFYRFAGLHVPETKIVKVAGSYGHASKMVPLDETHIPEDFNDGFVMDVFTANWDVVLNKAASEGKAIRLDNGGGLLFRAFGERKPAFTDIVIEIDTMRNNYPGLTDEQISAQLDKFRTKFTDDAIVELVDSVRMSKEDREYLKQVLPKRRDYMLAYFSGGLTETEESMTQERRTIEAALQRDTINDQQITELVPEWGIITGEEGYQHNKVLLGDHVKEAISILKSTPEFNALSTHEKKLALLAVLFHDIGKATGRVDEDVRRDYNHAYPSAQIAADYLKKWGYNFTDIKRVFLTIIYDGKVTDTLRGSVHVPGDEINPQQLRDGLGRDDSTIRILQAANKADASSVSPGGYGSIEARYNDFFQQALMQ